MLAKVLTSPDANGIAFWVWHTGCYVDPFTIWTSKKYPKIDEDGYYRSHAMPACMSVPVQVYAPTRSKAIGIYKHALAMFKDYKIGKAVISGRKV